MNLLLKIAKSNFGKIVLKSLSISTLIIFVLMFYFKKIRTLFPIPEINSDKLIGFAQYYGYPFYFDTIFFFFLIFLPVLVFIVVYLLSKNK
ncbi:MAG: hypothetical protein ACD_79C00735G0002 [uncultured bacterium]|nr:MAG: hypothetical protein ACD_79C00735G0002 [uncultured bacterium]KKQ28774.1 MAG: hypothetical protein US43_C0012G0005 [Candidatus Levybacteria bacterium GW2011_GWA1_37_16]KKQ38725.1 MAG: hypothetical protein US55_C0001G0013 [Candidatus Levybacteria bacterium GW2011_GWC2_37_7]KKQ42658.1 MAG: hypothetical protein US59_C0006G0013 [Candidatus Levybacteria bacterium GW2011_GWB1_37_8]OGH51005.1 MAG: hypothetical protein A3H17_01265 [Candidatus Levybacteria bacterium RIFCSPLOWO2_12_FULL_37_14]